MNYLAHAFLASDNEDGLIGSSIADMISSRIILPSKIQEGVQLHRFVDT